MTTRGHYGVKAKQIRLQMDSHIAHRADGIERPYHRHHLQALLFAVVRLHTAKQTRAIYYMTTTQDTFRATYVYRRTCLCQPCSFICALLCRSCVGSKKLRGRALNKRFVENCSILYFGTLMMIFSSLTQVYAYEVNQSTSCCTSNHERRGAGSI